jgi:bifunctional DNA-binding transcriptional regulator/antitoxin component of YhaV-PrlF toxin-antitoxin module
MTIFEEVRTVTANGRLVIPWVVQLALGLEHGGPVRLRVEDGVITLTAAAPREAEHHAPAMNGQRSLDARSALLAELKVLQAAAERDRGTGTSGL